MKNAISFINQLTKKLIIANVKDPLFELYYDFSYKIKNFDNIIYCYYNIDKINDALYDNDKIINIQLLKSSDDKLLYQYYFYIDLLINYNIHITNFEFSIDIIRNINEIQIDDSNKIKKIVKSKIVKDLINSYKSIHGNSDELKTIKIKTNLNILKESYGIFKEMNIEINDIKSIKLEEIYLKIIIFLIENRKFEDYEYTYDIIEQLNLEYINLTKIMIEKILQILNSEESFIKDYIIFNCNDLLDIKKINFYYILLKYILKNSFYIYQIPFLLKTKKIIIQAIKEKNNSLFTDINDKQFNEKIKYIIEILSDSPYFISKYNSKELKNEFDDSKNENINSIKTQSSSSSIYNENNKTSNINENNNLIENKSHITGQTFNISHCNDKEVSDSFPPDESYSLELKLFNFKKDAINIMKELTNGFIIISGNNNLVIYNYEYHKLESFDFEEPIYNIFEVNTNIYNGNKKNSLSFIINFKNNKFYEYEFLIKNDNELKPIPRNGKKYLYPYSLFYLERNEQNNFRNIFCGSEGIIYYPNFFSKITENKLDKPKFKDPIYGGIQIDNDYAVLISKNQENKNNSNFKLILLNIKEDKIQPLEIEDYSLNLSPNCLSFLKINNEKNKILVLCACKTKKNEINGFLYFIFGENKPIFHGTDIKVNCFCQLSKFHEVSNSISNENKNYKIEGTNYFLVGGGNEKDKSTKKGIIKLLKYDESSNKIKNGNEIKNDFNESISCIIQTRRNGNILISCKDENFYVCDRKCIKDIQ